MAAVNRTTPGLSGVAVPAAGPAPIAASAQTAQQVFDRSLEVDRQLRSALRKKGFYDVEVRQLKHQLRELYEAVIFKDYTLAQTHDVEQLMWKAVFYHTIEGFRQRIQTATKAGESGREGLKKVTAAYLKYLDDARLFYKQLLYKLQAWYGDVGAVIELEAVPALPDFVRPPASYDSRVSAQRFLIYLGDLSRYKAQVLRGNRGDWQLASSFYKQAGRVYPRSGNPFNQLGVIAFYLKDEMRAVYYYFRSLSVITPFLTARENLKLLFEKNRGRFSHVAARGVNKQLSWANALDAKQTMSNTTAELSICFVRMSGILFDHINSEQFEDAKRLGFKLLRQVLTAKTAVELLAAAPVAENVLLHLLVLGVFSVYNTETYGPRQPGRATGSDLLQLSRYHHQAASVAFQYSAYVCEALSSNVEAGHAPLSAVVILVLQWVQAQPQLVKQQGKELPAEKILALTSFWKALCKLLLKCGEAARQQNVNFRQKMVGALPEELEFVGFEPFRIDPGSVAALSVQARNDAQLRLIRIIQGCRQVADIMQPYARSLSTETAGPLPAPEPGVASRDDVAAYKSAIELFCTAVDLLYVDQDLSRPAFQVLSSSILIDLSDINAKTSAASSIEQGSSPMNTAMSASAMLGPQSGSTYRSTTFSSTGADVATHMEEAALLESASADMQDLLTSDAAGNVAAAATAAAALPDVSVQQQAGIERLAVEIAAMKDGPDADGEEEEEEVIVFQPQSISRPPSRAPEPAAPTGSAGVSRAASAASFPVSPTVSAHQQFNLFANDASLALYRLVTSGGVQLDQQLSLDSVRSEVSGSVSGGPNAREQVVSTPRGQSASPASSLKVSPAAGQLPEPPAEWTAQMLPTALGLSQPVSGKHSNKSSPQLTPLPVPGSMPPPPPTSLQLAAMSAANTTTSSNSAAGYGFGAIGAQRVPSPSQTTSPMLTATVPTPTTAPTYPDHVPNRPANVPIMSPVPTGQPNVVPPQPPQPPAANAHPQDSIVSLLQQLQNRPVQDVPPLPVPTGAVAHSSSLPPHPASPSLRGIAPHPTVAMPSRLSLSSSEQIPPPRTSSPTVLLQSGRFSPQSGQSGPWNPNPPSVVAIQSTGPAVGVVAPPPGFGDVLTLAQLEQATMAAHQESVANDQAEATAMAAVGQLLDEASPPSLAPVAAVQLSSHPTVPIISQYPTPLPPMPSDKFLFAPMPQPVQALPVPSIPVPSTSHIEPSPFSHSSPGISHPAPGQHSPMSHPLELIQGPSPLPQQYATHPVLQAFGVHAADPLRASLPVPGGLLGKSMPSGPVRQSSFPPAGSMTSTGQILSFASAPHMQQLPERETPNTGFSFLDILEAHHTQGVEYGASAHLYSTSVAEAATVSFPMLVPSANMGYRTAEPLPQ